MKHTEDSHHGKRWKSHTTKTFGRSGRQGQPLTDSMKVLDSEHGMVSESVTCSVKGAGHLLADGEEESELWLG